MSVKTGQVRGRRTVQYESLDDLLTDAEALAGSRSVRTLGNWSLGQILAHLAAGLDLAVDGPRRPAPLFLRIIGPIIKYRVLRKMSPGIQLPPAAAEQLVPKGDCSPQEGLQKLQAAIRRFRSDLTRKPHPVFGRLSAAQWHQLALRHAELHMSFATFDSPQTSNL